MNVERTLGPVTTPRPSVLSRLKLPALLLFIAMNLVAIGGNSAIDLWQTFGPGTAFSGRITGHDDIVPQSEGQEESYILTVDTGQSPLRFRVPEHTFNDTRTGQQVTGELDARGILGHDEGLRTMTADGKPVFRSNARNRAIGEFVILGIVLGVAGLVVRWLIARRRPRPAA